MICLFRRGLAVQNLECCCFAFFNKFLITCSSMLTWRAVYELQILRVYTRVHGGRGYDYTRIYYYVLTRIKRACSLNWPARAHVLADSSVLSITTCKRIQFECQSFRKFGTISADGWTRDRGTNIVTVLPISGQLATMCILCSCTYT